MSDDATIESADEVAGKATERAADGADAAGGPTAVPQVGDAPASYAAACDELDEILAELEDGRADIDALTTQVGRARSLLAFCEERLQGTRLHVRDVLDELDGG